MSIRKIATLGHPILRQVAQEVPVAEIDSDMIQRIILDLLDTVEEANGAGLAAPQIHESFRIVVLKFEILTVFRKSCAPNNLSSRICDMDIKLI